MSNPLLNLTPKNLKNLCFGCEKCKDDPFDVFICKEATRYVWVRNHKHGIYLSGGSYEAGRHSFCERANYKLISTEIHMNSYTQLVEIMNVRFPNWLE
jgi:hypothetical protein